MVNNSSKINKTSNVLSPQIIEHKKDPDICLAFPPELFSHFFLEVNNLKGVRKYLGYLCSNLTVFSVLKFVGTCLQG
jgi:hypothetical protein